MLVNDVLQGLGELAARYERAARDIRAVMVTIQTTEEAREVAPETDGHPVSISEAVRIVLGKAKRPMRSREIWEAFQEHRVLLRTRSRDPRALLDSTLTSMSAHGQIRKTADGWVGV